MSLLMSRATIADEFELSPSSVEKLTARSDFPDPIRIGRSVRWRRIDVEGWIDRQTARPTVEQVGRRKSAEELLA